jgi:hypothetical protein
LLLRFVALLVDEFVLDEAGRRVVSCLKDPELAGRRAKCAEWSTSPNSGFDSATGRSDRPEPASIVVA